MDYVASLLKCINPENEDLKLYVIERDHFPSGRAKTYSFCVVSDYTFILDITWIIAGISEVQTTPKGYLRLKNKESFAQMVLLIHAAELAIGLKKDTFKVRGI